MATSNTMPGHTARPPRPRRTIVPRSAIGWWALGGSAVGIASWVVLPAITGRFHDVYPITDTWVMPVIGTVLIDLAAIMNALVIWRWRDRSVLNIIATVLTGLLALFFTLFVVGEGLSGA